VKVAFGAIFTTGKKTLPKGKSTEEADISFVNAGTPVVLTRSSEKEAPSSKLSANQ